VVGQATSPRAEYVALAGPAAVTIRQDQPFQASARFALGPFFTAQWSPTNRQLAGEAHETSLAKTLRPYGGAGTGSATQLPPLNISDRAGVILPELKVPIAMQKTLLVHESLLR
jgi:hypothetical protein